MSISSYVNQSCCHTEQAFNLLECIPVAGVFTSVIRAHLGAIQATAGVIVIIAGGIGLFSSTVLTSNQQASEKFKRIIRFGEEHALHGALNVLRGLSVTFIGVMTGGFGNLAMLIPNMTSKFYPLFDYKDATMYSMCQA